MCESNSRFDDDVCREGKGVCVVRGIAVCLSVYCFLNHTHMFFSPTTVSTVQAKLVFYGESDNKPGFWV